MRRGLGLSLFTVLLLFSPPSGAVDEARGKQLFVVCSACHGADGGGNAQIGAPSIAGLHEWYMVRQLNKFREGKRGAHFDDPGGERMRVVSEAVPRRRYRRENYSYFSQARCLGRGSSGRGKPADSFLRRDGI